MATVPTPSLNSTAPTAAPAAADASQSVKAVSPSSDSDGKISFSLPIEAKDIASIEAVDVDLVIVTTQGERLLLPEAAINASTAANPKISFTAGDATDAANLFKKVGLLKPVVGGSFRLQATDLKPTPADQLNGQSVGLGSDEATQVKTLKDQISNLQEKVSQAQAAAKVSVAQAQEIPQFKSNSVAVAQNTLTSSSSASATKTKTQDNTQTEKLTKTGDADATQNYPNITSPGQKGADIGKVSGVHISSSQETFGSTDVRFMLADNRLQVSVDSSAGTVELPSGNEAGKVYTSLVFSGQSKLASIHITHNSQLTSDTAPSGFRINGVDPFASGAHIVIAADGVNGGRAQMKWDVAGDGSMVMPASATLNIEYRAADNSVIAKVLTTKFVFGNADSSNIYELDGNGNPIIKLLAGGLSYDITGRDGVDDNIAAGNGSDVVSGLNGNDTLDGDLGADILFGGSYGTSLASFSEASDSATGTGDDTLLGGTGNDKLYGQDGNDTLTGGAGNDWLVGGAGADHLNGDVDSDTVSYAGSGSAVSVHLALEEQGSNSGGDALGDYITGVENIAGSSHHDLLVGDSQSNVLSGGAGDDTLEGRAGADTLDGGDGSNTASYVNAGSVGLTASLQASTGNTGEAAGDSYINIQNITGSGGDDILTGSSSDGSAAGNVLQSNFLQGLDGNDTLNGLAGDDTLAGGNGNDILNGGLGADTLQGGAGADTASYANASTGIKAYLLDTSKSVGEAVGDSYTSIESLTGSAYADTLAGDQSANTLDGGAGDDILIGGEGGDKLYGGDGADTASYETAASAVRVSLKDTSTNIGDAQNDSYFSIENLTGSAYADVLIGNTLSNRLSGGLGADTLIGGGGGDTYQGDVGADTVDYATAASAVTVFMETAQQALNAGSAVGDTYLQIENITGSQYNDMITGDNLGNTLIGGEGNDTLDGGTGASVSDKLNGGLGQDTVTYVNAASGVTLSLISGGSTGDATGDDYSLIEDVIGSGYNDTLEGDSGNNVIRGGNGDDNLKGGGASDTLYGDAGDDTLSNLATKGSVQTYYGGDGLTDTGNDTVSYEGSEKIINVSLLSGGYIYDTDGTTKLAEQVFNGVENLTGGNRGDVLEGNSKSNLLSGGAADDILRGLAGNDNLQGGSGADTLTGGAGADTLNGGAGSDTVSYADSLQAQIIDLAVTVAGDGNGRGSSDAAGDSFTEIEIVVGSRYADVFYASLDATKFMGGDESSLATVSDTVNYSADLYGINLTLNASGGSVVWDASQPNSLIKGDTFFSIENVVGAQKSGNTITGDGQANVLTGGDKDDTLSGGDGNDTLIGGLGNNTLDGGAGNDTLSAVSGNNEFSGGTGNDTISGGSGNTDTVSYAYFGGNVIIDLSLTGEQTNMTSDDRDTLSGIENLTGSNGDDTLSGNLTANVLSGAVGNDTLYGHAGADTLIGGLGDDILVGGAGADTLIGGTEADGSDASTAGKNTASYEDASVGVTASLFNRLGNTEDAVGDNYINIQNLTGSGYVDTLTGDAQANVLSGLAGNDSLRGGAGNDILNGEAGDDTLYGEEDDDTLNGGDGNDTLSGGEGSNTLNGNAGNDTFAAGAGIDSYVGGAGVNTVSYDGSTGVGGVGITIDLVDGGNGTGNAAGDTFSDIQTVIGTSGADFFVESNDAMAVKGGGGTDTVSYNRADAAVTASLADGGTDGWAKGDSYVAIANLTGSDFADFLTGNTSRNTLSGGAGDDTFYGMINTGSVADNYDGGFGTDTLTYANIDAKYSVTAVIDNDGNGTAKIYEGSTLKQTDTFSAMENVDTSSGNSTGGGGTVTTVNDEGTSQETTGSSLTGNLSANTLVGTQSKDTISGDGGNDILRGLGGDDTLNGGTGNDALYGGSGTDTVNGDVGDDTLMGGSGADTLNGDAGNDILYGFGNAAYVTSYSSAVAGDGADTLDGGLGNNHFYGGAGADRFLGGFNLSTAAYNAYTSDFADGGSLTNLAQFTGNFARYEDQSGAGVIDFSGSGLATIGQAVGDTYDADMTGAIGFAGATTFYGRTTGEIFIGNDGNDVFKGSLGADVFDGKVGNDTADYSADTSAITVNLETNSNNGSFAAGDKLFNIETVKGGSGQNTLTANAMLDTTLTGGIANDTLTGGSGNDTLSGGDGNDTLKGGDGNDILTAGNGVDSLNGGAGDDTLDLTKSSDANLNGNRATGDAGNDTVKVSVAKLAGAGSTFMADGGSGTDTLELWATGNSNSLTTFDLSTITRDDFVSDFTSFEVLDLSKDNIKTNFKFSSESIQALVDNGDNSVLTIRLKAGQDELTLPVEATIQVGGNQYDYYADTTYQHKVASVVVDYV
jgi:Ca2+-binding RTX toxin-like protein